MGVTLSSKQISVDMGYGGFKRFREKVATLAGEKFGQHYASLQEVNILPDEQRASFYETYNKQTDQLIEQHAITPEIANFCYQSDCEGAIDQQQAMAIYEKIKDHLDETPYGYVGRKDCAMFADLKAMFKDCAENGGNIEWY